jgi:hypothetical protein
MAEATGNLKFLPRCNGDLSQKSNGPSAILTVQQFLLPSDSLCSAQCWNYSNFNRPIDRSSGVANTPSFIGPWLGWLHPQKIIARPRF